MSAPRWSCCGGIEHTATCVELARAERVAAAHARTPWAYPTTAATVRRELIEARQAHAAYLRTGAR